MNNNKFNLAPGFAGMGEIGEIGGIGLNGISTYFCDYSGINDLNSITNKIKNNKELFKTDNHIPGYPERLYQTGDLIIDKHADVFQIDLSTVNLFTSESTSLATSVFLEAGQIQYSSPNFSRYNNRFGEKVIIDSIYATAAIDYHDQYPILGIYETSPIYYSNINFIDVSIINNGGIGTYFPFQLWGTGIDSNDDCLALTREYNENVWHLGNKQHDEIRNIDLSLDFINVNMRGNLNIDASVSSPECIIDSTVHIGEVGKSTSLGNYIIGGDTSINHQLHTPDLNVGLGVSAKKDLTVAGSIESGNLSTAGILMCGGDASIGGTLLIDTSVNLTEDLTVIDYINTNHADVKKGLDGDSDSEIHIHSDLDIKFDASVSGELHMNGDVNITNPSSDKTFMYMCGFVDTNIRDASNNWFFYTGDGTAEIEASNFMLPQKLWNYYDGGDTIWTMLVRKRWEVTGTQHVVNDYDMWRYGSYGAAFEIVNGALDCSWLTNQSTPWNDTIKSESAIGGGAGDQYLGYFNIERPTKAWVYISYAGSTTYSWCVLEIYQAGYWRTVYSIPVSKYNSYDNGVSLGPGRYRFRTRVTVGVAFAVGAYAEGIYGTTHGPMD